MTEVDLKDAGFHKLGRNVKIHSRSSIYGTENISIGDNVRIDDFAVIIATGEIRIGSHVTISCFSFIGGTNGVVFEDFSSIGQGTKILTASDDYSGAMLTNPTVPREFTGGTAGKVVLKKHVIVGAGSVILPGCSIGTGSSVGALSLVNRCLDPWGVYVGIPVRKIKDRKKDLLVLEQQLKQKEGWPL